MLFDMIALCWYCREMQLFSRFFKQQESSSHQWLCTRQQHPDQEVQQEKNCSKLTSSGAEERIQNVNLEGTALSSLNAVWLLLLTPLESSRSPLAWLDEYRLTYSPSPPSSLAFWFYREKEESTGRKQKAGVRLKEDEWWREEAWGTG